MGVSCQKQNPSIDGTYPDNTEEIKAVEQAIRILEKWSPDVPRANGM
jgi:hypothetical protein